MQSIQLQAFSGYLQGQGQSRYHINDLSWQVNQGEHWLLLGANGAGKSAITAVLAGEAKHSSGKRSCSIDAVQLVSSDAQKQLINKELKNDKQSSVKELLLGTANYDVDLAQRLINILDFEKLLARHFRELSTGETRKLLLIKALSSRPNLVVLDEPFDGLDVESSTALNVILAQLSEYISFVFVVNRVDEIPAFITHYGYVNQGCLQSILAHPNAEQVADLLKLLHLVHIPEHREQ